MRDENGAFGEMREVEIFHIAEQLIDDATADIAEVGGAFCKERIADSFEGGDEFIGGFLEGVVDIDSVLFDASANAFEQGGVFENQQVCVKNFRFFRSEGGVDLVADLLYFDARGDQGGAETFDFGGNFFDWDGAVGNVARASPQENRPAVGDAVGGSDAVQDFFTVMGWGVHEGLGDGLRTDSVRGSF